MAVLAIDRATVTTLAPYGLNNLWFPLKTGNHLNIGVTCIVADNITIYFSFASGF